jgi:hypothetical protein
MIMEIFWSFISNYLILFRKFVNFIFEIKKGSLATPREGALLRVCLPPDAQRWAMPGKVLELLIEPRYKPIMLQDFLGSL